MLYGGSILPGHLPRRAADDPGGVRGRRRPRRRAIDDAELKEIEEAASPGAGACGGQFTANTMAMAFEVLGISPSGSRLVPAVDQRKAEVAQDAGGWSWTCSARPRPERLSSPATASRTRSPRSPAAAARPTASCTCWRSPRRWASSCRSTTSTGSPSARRCCATSSPAVGTWRSTSYAGRRRAAGAQALQEAGLLHEDALTVTGQTVGEIAAAAERDRGPARSCARSTSRSGRPAAWRSCTATSRPTAAWSSWPATSAARRPARRACSSARRTRWRP